MAKLKRELTLGGLTMIAVGSCIGSGIFLTPSGIANYLPHHGLVLLAWLIGGLVSFAGAMVFSELSARFPNSGGVYVYLKEAYGDIAGFLYGWVILLIINTGALAALSMALADYMTYFFPFGSTEKLIFAISIIIGLTGLNILGVNISQVFAKLFTSLKLMALLLIVLIGMVYMERTSHNIELMSALPSDINPLQAFLLAFVGVFWSFGGWHHTTYLSGEAKNPQYTVPRAMLLGTMIVTIVYLLANLAYMSLLPLNEIAASEKVAGDALKVVLDSGGKLITIVIAISIFGTIGIYTMTAPRIYFAMAKDGIFFNSLSKVHHRFKTPHYAMIFQAVWAIILLMMWGSFVKIITFVTFMDIVFMALAAITLFVFRKRKGIDVAFKTPWYPVIPIFYLLVTIAFVINTLIDLNVESLVGTTILILGIPAYFYFKKTKNI